MNEQASTIIAQEFIKGTLDVFDAMLGASFAHSVGNLEERSTDAMDELLATYPVAWRAELPSGGAMALLFTDADMGQLVALVEGTEAGPLQPAQLASLREIADPALGSGVTSVLTKCAKDLEQPKNVQVSVAGSEPVDWAAFFGPSIQTAAFTYSAPPQFDNSSGLFIFSEALADLAAALVVKPEMKPASSLLLSEDEMNDILKTLDPEGISQASASAAPVAARPEPRHSDHRSPARHPSNIDMVLDIQLVVTARLGRVEMPIGDILALGPGSIVDVGRLVDEPVELLVNGKLIARGDVVVVDEKFGLRITEIVGPKERIESMH